MMFSEMLRSRVENPKTSVLHGCPHVLLLPPLRPEEQAIIDAHNRDCLEILNSVILPYAQSYKPADDAFEKYLPLSDAKVSHLSAEGFEPAGGLFQTVVDSATPVVARSPLAALGGVGDLFSTQADLRTMREGLTAADVGMLINEDVHGHPQPLNAYLLDLWRHTNYESLLRFNVFSDADLYEGCAFYLQILKSIRTAIYVRQGLGSGQNDILRAFARLIKDFDAKFNYIFKLKRRDFSWLIIRGVEGYSGDLPKHILQKTRVSVPYARKLPTAKHHDYIFKIPCRSDTDRQRLVSQFADWKGNNWWIDEVDSDDEDEDMEIV